MDMQILKIESQAHTQKQLLALKINDIDIHRQNVISKSKQADIALKALDALSLATKSPYVQMSIKTKN